MKDVIRDYDKFFNVISNYKMRLEETIQALAEARNTIKSAHTVHIAHEDLIKDINRKVNLYRDDLSNLIETEARIKNIFNSHIQKAFNEIYSMFKDPNNGMEVLTERVITDAFDEIDFEASNNGMEVSTERVITDPIIEIDFEE